MRAHCHQAHSKTVIQCLLLAISASGTVSGLSPSPEGVQRFTLPSQRQDNPDEGAPVEQSGRLMILVEDNVGDARLVREALENSSIPCDLVVITNGQSALQFIEDIDSGSGLCPQLAIVDLNLPKKPGSRGCQENAGKREV